MESLPRSAAVLLARLLLPPVARLATLRKDVAGVLGDLDDAAWTRAISSLTDAGLVTATPAVRAAPTPTAGTVQLHLLDAGRTAAMDRLGRLAGASKFTATRFRSYWAGRPSPSVAAVLLTRLYMGPAKVVVARRAVADVIGPVNDAAWAAGVASLVAAGHVNDPVPPAAAPTPAAKSPAVSPLPLTDRGRVVAAAWLGMAIVPPDLTWPTVRDQWLRARVAPEAHAAVPSTAE